MRITAYNLYLQLKVLSRSKENNTTHFKSKFFIHRNVRKNRHRCKHDLSYEVASWSEITPCIKIDKPLLVYRF